jgi:hypothetical protein
VPTELATICSRCLEKEAEKRPKAGQLAEMLERFVAGGAPQPEPFRRRWRQSWIVPALLFGAVFSLLLVLWIAGSVLLSARKGAQAVAQTLTVRLRVAHVGIVVKDGEKLETEAGEIGSTSFGANYGDGVRLFATLSEPGYAYLVALNTDGREQLLWPVNDREAPDEEVVPTRQKQLAFPVQQSNLFYLDDDVSGGLQVFGVLASREPLSSYAEWKRERGAIAWPRQPARAGVWIADLKGIYRRTKGQPEDRGTAGQRPGMPPLMKLAQSLQVAGVEQVELLAFPVKAKEAGR